MTQLLKVFLVVAFICSGVNGQIITTPTPGLSANVTYVNAGANLFAAKTAATAGTTIVVGPGMYSSGATNLLKDGVNWFFFPGAVVSNWNGGTSPTGIFMNDRYGTTGPMRCTIGGNGTFIQRGGWDESDIVAMCSVSNLLSDVLIEGDQFLTSGDSSTFYIATTWEGRLTLKANIRMDSAAFPTESAGVSKAGGLWWKLGSGSFSAPLICSSGASTIYNLGDGPGDWDLNFERIRATNASAVWLEPSHIDSKTWITAKEIIGGSNAISRGTAISANGGKLYLNAQKISSFNSDGLPVILLTNGATWITAQKVTTTNVSHWLTLGSGFADIVVSEWEDNGPGLSTRPYNFLVSGGTNYIRNGRAVSKWGPGFKTTGGKSHLSGFTMNTFSTLQGSNVCLWITGGTNYVENCRFISGSLFSVSNASAGDLRIAGTGGLMANSNITATLTVRGGSFIQDAWTDQ